jgi:hypothetical protein
MITTNGMRSQRNAATNSRSSGPGIAQIATSGFKARKRRTSLDSKSGASSNRQTKPATPL